MQIKNLLGEFDGSLTPTKKGFTPVAFLVAASAVCLVLFGAVRVGICVKNDSSSCDAEWESLLNNTKAAGLGMVGLAAQSPWTKAAHVVLGAATKAAEKPAPTRRKAPAEPKVEPTTRRRRTQN